MSTVETQIEIERRSLFETAEKYKASVAQAESAGRIDDLGYARCLVTDLTKHVADALAITVADKKPRADIGKYRSLLRTMDLTRAAYIGLRVAFMRLTRDAGNTPAVELASAIGAMLEDELHFSRFREKHGEYYEALIRDLKRRGTRDYRHMHRVLTHKANQYGVGWASWGGDVRIGVGMCVLDAILRSTDIIERTDDIPGPRKRARTTVMIRYTSAATGWIARYHEYAELLRPIFPPLVIKPDDWTDVRSGGYYTPELRRSCPMVKVTCRGKPAARIWSTLDDADLAPVMSAINTLQAVAWKVNTKVLDVVSEVWDRSLGIGLPRSEPIEIPICPVRDVPKDQFTEEQAEIFAAWKRTARALYTEETTRVAKSLAVVGGIRMAREYAAYDRIWFVWQCDWRGRAYTSTTWLSPQGADYGKALLHFADGKPLGVRGVYWLAAHGASCYGHDKLPYDDRVQWAHDNSDIIRATAEDPISHRDFWGNADKPWQFLAFCFEWVGYLSQGVDYVSHLPISLDGSCNGLQNFSALLADPIGGAATNLTPADKPADIYAEVARVLSNMIMETTCPTLQIWRDYVEACGGCVPRGLTKRAVMTLPYGSTKQSCTEYIREFIAEEAADFFPPDQAFMDAVRLCPLLWDAMGRVVVAAREAMDWLHQCAGIISKANKMVMWYTPLGFPVCQSYLTYTTVRKRTELHGMYRFNIAVESDTQAVSKAKNGISPNFIHSMDACHMMMTVNMARSRGITSFSVIHDDFGTHAADTDMLHRCIREAFVDMYADSDLLYDFSVFAADHAGVVLPAPPKKGRLNIRDVLESKYFFN